MKECILQANNSLLIGKTNLFSAFLSTNISGLTLRIQPSSLYPNSAMATCMQSVALAITSEQKTCYHKAQRGAIRKLVLLQHIYSSSELMQLPAHAVIPVSAVLVWLICFVPLGALFSLVPMESKNLESGDKIVPLVLYKADPTFRQIWSCDSGLPER